MSELKNWQGKADEIEIEFDACVRKTDLLTMKEQAEIMLPAVIYPEIDNLFDIAEISWNEKIKKADRLDYILAVSSGAISGLVDVFYVGAFSLENSNDWGKAKVSTFVKKVARLNGFKGDDLSDAIVFLEKKYRLAADGLTPEFGGGRQHHLRDFSHHFSLGGLVCSLFTQFTGKVIGTDVKGGLIIVELKDKTFIGKNFEEKILFGTVSWFFHMVSDMAGTNVTSGNGTGIPGPLVSLIKELSALPCFRDRKISETEFHTWVSKLFNGTLLAKRDENGKILKPIKFDLRSEIGLLHEFAKQAVPVLLNECLVRGMYFIRRLSQAFKQTEINSLRDLQKLDTSELLPFNNRTVKRMVTVASGTFCAIDISDAFIRAAMKDGIQNPKFIADFAVRINFVGIGRFVIAVKADWEFIKEDIKEAREAREKTKRDYEKQIGDLKCFELEPEQSRILYSIQRKMLLDDIANTKDDEKRKLKTKWMVEWRKSIITAMMIPKEDSRTYFLSEKELKNSLNVNNGAKWVQLVAFEALLFEPYIPIFSDQEKNKALKKLKYTSNYLTDWFAETQNAITAKDLKILKKAYSKAQSKVKGSTEKIVIGVIGTTAAAAATGGLAYLFAPAIAVTIAGGAAAGLSGAALTSFSLAFVGGGSLAVGGLGMAGGTAIIAGGGALLGALGATGITATSSMSILLNDDYVQLQCSKILAYSTEVLYERYTDFKSIRNNHLILSERINQVEKDLEDLKNTVNPDYKKEISEKIKTATKSIKYMKRCDEELEKLLERYHI